MWQRCPTFLFKVQCDRYKSVCEWDGSANICKAGKNTPTPQSPQRGKWHLIKKEAECSGDMLEIKPAGSKTSSEKCKVLVLSEYWGPLCNKIAISNNDQCKCLASVPKQRSSKWVKHGKSGYTLEAE